MMKKIILFLIFFFIPITVVYAVDIPSIEGQDVFNDTIKSMLSGNFILNPATLINTGLDILLNELRQSGDILLNIMVIGAVSAIINIINNAFNNNGVGEVSFYACFTLVSASALSCFSIVLKYGMEVITAMTEFITKLSPLLMTLILSSGGTASATVFHPILSGAVYVVTIISNKCIIPLSAYGAVLSVVDNLSDEIQISGFNKMVMSTSKWILAASFTLFTGICGIYGFSAPALDVMSAKTVKFAVGSLVPVVGNFLSDTLETVVTGSKMMKNAVGGGGLFCVCAICIVPILKIAAILFMLKLCATAVEPITDKRISKLLWDMSGAVTQIFAMVITVAVLFIICISIILASTTLNV